jgi:hypothetical protein
MIFCGVGVGKQTVDCIVKEGNFPDAKTRAE